MLFLRAGIFRPLTTSLAAVGRMALSNYLATTLICTTLFNGYGFGLFGSLHRYQLYGVLLGVWAAATRAQPDLVPLFLVRAGRMALALPYVLEAATDAKMKRPPAVVADERPLKS